MKLKANIGYYLTQVDDVPASERRFETGIYLETAADALKWREVDEMEKNAIIYQATVLDVAQLSPQYLDTLDALSGAIPARINEKAFSQADALKHKAYYPEWGDRNAPMGKEVDAGFRFRHRAGGEGEYTLYEVRQKHCLAAEWVPGVGTAALYMPVEEEAQEEGNPAG